MNSVVDQHELGLWIIFRATKIDLLLVYTLSLVLMAECPLLRLLIVEFGFSQLPLETFDLFL